MSGRTTHFRENRVSEVSRPIGVNCFIKHDLFTFLGSKKNRKRKNGNSMTRQFLFCNFCCLCGIESCLKPILAINGRFFVTKIRWHFDDDLLKMDFKRNGLRF